VMPSLHPRDPDGVASWSASRSSSPLTGLLQGLGNLGKLSLGVAGFVDGGSSNLMVTADRP
jgi:hypothetical protein